MTAPCLACGYDATARVVARREFVVPRDLPSLNQRIHNGARGWQYRKARAAWYADFTIIRYAQKIPAAKASRRVTLVRMYSKHQRLMDKANVDTKVCVDALVLAGLLKDDAPQWLELHVKQERGKERGTRVLIEEVSQ